MLKATEAAAIVANVLAEREATRLAHIANIAEQEVAPAIEEAANDGKSHLILDINVAIYFDLKKILTGNGYVVEYDSINSKMKITW